ncbi:hypothetical protein J2847_005503 [Azospirillum agricola]|nr:hypothetical protein [Azospirillum agricola]
MQMATRRRAWTLVERDGALWDRMRSEWTRTDGAASRSAGLSALR